MIDQSTPPGSPSVDVIVIGAGPAGLSGATALLRFRRSVVVIDAGQPRNATAGHVHNFLTRDGTPPAELLALGRAEVEGYGGSIVTGEVVAVRRAAPGAGGFVVELGDGRSFAAPRLLVTTGLVDELPDLPGVRELWGVDVLHCPYCHGWEVRDQPLGILATSPLVTHQAQLFRQLSADVVVFAHQQDLTDTQREELMARGIGVVEGEVTELVTTDGRLSGVRLSTGAVVPRRALAVGARVQAQASFLTPLGLAVTDLVMNGFSIGTALTADAMGATSVPGVWAAGNVTDPRAQVISSAAAGLNAAAALNGDLVLEEIAAAVATHRQPAAELSA